MTAMNNTDNQRKELTERTEELLGSWLYPNAQGSPTLASDELDFFHCQYQTPDSFEEVGQYYFNELSPDRPFESHGGSVYSIGEDRKWLFRYSPPNYLAGPAASLLVTHADENRTISIVVVPAVEEERLVLLITFEGH